MKRLNKFFILSILLPVIAYWRWFITPYMYSWGDWGYQGPEIVKQWFWFPQAWLREFMGRVDAGLPLYVSTRLFYSTFAQFLPFVGYDRLTFLIPSVLVPAISVYLLVKQHTKSSLAGFIGSIVYTFNTYTLLLNTGHLTLATSYGFIPLLFIFFKKAIYKRSLKYTAATGLIGFLCSAYEVRGFYIGAVILMSYLIYSVFLSKETEFSTKSQKIKSLFLGILSLVIVALTNAYWVAGFVQTSSSYIGISILNQLVGEFNSLLPIPMLLFSPWWTGNSTMAWGTVQSIPLYFWVIPFVVILGFWFNRHKSDTRFWTLISLLGIFLVKSSGEPFGNIYSWLFYHFPGFEVFRDSSKFNFYISLGYSILIGDFISWLWNTKKRFYIYKILLTALILGVFVYNGIPLLKGELGELQKPRTIPNDYVILNKYLLSQSQFMRVLYIPTFTKWGPRDSEHREVSVYEQVHGEWQKFNNYNKTGLEYSAFDDVTGIFNKPFANDLLDQSSIKYVVVPIEDKENDEMFIFPLEFPRQEYIDFLSTLSYLKRIDIGTKELAIYENSNSLPHFYFNKPVDYKINCLDATTCTLTFNSTAQNLQFYFSDSYHSGWKIRLGEFHWWNSLFNKNYFLPDQIHKSTQYGTNEFFISGVNPGSTFTLYFYPQAYVNIGTIISLLTIGSCLIILCRIRK